MLTAVVLTKNEEKKIKRCLGSLAFCDELIVVDDFSTDRTVEIAKRMGAVIYRRSVNGDFASQRNFALSKAKHDWVFFVDADELVTDKLRLEIVSKINNPLLQEVGYSIKRNNYFLGKQLRYGEAASVLLVRLAKKDSGVWRRRVHEYWDVEGKIGRLGNKIDHYFCDTLSDFIEKINFYSDLHARANLEDKKKSNLLKILFYPMVKFFDGFLLKGGFLDGPAGFVFAVFMSFHSFLAWSKLWLLQRGKKLPKY